jgi:hypothetical protein
VKRCKLFMKCCTLFSANSICARECVAHHGMALESAPIGKIKSGKQNTEKRYTPNSATPIGANTLFLQIGKCYTPFTALHQFFPTLPIICAQVAAKRFMQYTRYCPFNKIMSSAPILKHITHRLTPFSTHLSFRWTIAFIHNR